MKKQRKAEKSQKISENDLFSIMAKKKFLYEDSKKIMKVNPSLEKNIFSEGKVFSESEKIITDWVENSLNNKEALSMRTPMCVYFKTRSNNLKDLPVTQVVIRKRSYSEKPESQNQLFNKEYITNDIFCEFFI